MRPPPKLKFAFALILFANGIAIAIRGAGTIPQSRPAKSDRTVVDRQKGQVQGERLDTVGLRGTSFADLGAKVTATYHGDAIGIAPVANGAQLHTAFQKLSASATGDGLRVTSTAEKGGQLHLIASAIGTAKLPARGTVAIGNNVVSFKRPGLTEEYSVSVDGVRQDFVILQRPADSKELTVALDLSGAKAKTAAYGVKVTLDGSDRELAYSRLRASDAAGRELPASIEVVTANRLAVHVADDHAVYPVRIDPTFSDANWVSLNSGIPGTNGTVNATAVDGSGNI